MPILVSLVQHMLIFFPPIQFNRCMVGYINASLSVFRVSDFEERSQPLTTPTGAQLLGDVKYCRYWGSAILDPKPPGFTHRRVWRWCIRSTLCHIQADQSDFFVAMAETLKSLLLKAEMTHAKIRHQDLFNNKIRTHTNKLFMGDAK